MINPGQGIGGKGDQEWGMLRGSEVKRRVRKTMFRSRIPTPSFGISRRRGPDDKTVSYSPFLRKRRTLRVYAACVMRYL